MSGRSAPTRRAWLVALALLAASFAAFILAGRERVQSGAVVPNKVRQAVPATPTRAGAVDTAVAYAMSLRWDVLIDDERRQDVLARYASDGAAKELEADLATNVEPVRAAVSVPPVVARRALLGSRIDEFEPPRASVSLWGFVLFATGAYGPVTQWSTSQLDLAWDGGRWRVADVTSHGGPSPESSLAALARADVSFREIRRVP